MALAHVHAARRRAPRESSGRSGVAYGSPSVAVPSESASTAPSASTMSVRLPSPTLAWRAIERSVRVTGVAEPRRGIGPARRGRRRARPGPPSSRAPRPRPPSGARRSMFSASGTASATTTTARRYAAPRTRRARKLTSPRSKRKPTPRTVWMYRGCGGVVSELLAQRAHVHVERLRRAEPRRIPDLVDDLVAAHDLAGALEQHAQELELLHGQVERHAVAASRCACPGRAARRRTRAPSPSPPPGSRSLRRSTARIRATSSAALNGFVT